MHRLVIYENTQKLIGRCCCGHWKQFRNRICPIIGDNWIILNIGNPGVLRMRIINSFQGHARRHSPLHNARS